MAQQPPQRPSWQPYAPPPGPHGPTPPQQAWHGSPTPRPGGTGKIVAIVLVIATAVIVLIGTIAVITVVTRSGDPASTSVRPEEIVVNYLSALNAGECERATGLLAEAHLRDTGITSEEAVADCYRVEGLPENVGATLTVESTRLITEYDDRAVVEARFTLDAPASGRDPVTQEADYILHKEAGEWRIYDVGDPRLIGP